MIAFMQKLDSQQVSVLPPEEIIKGIENLETVEEKAEALIELM